MTIAVALLNPQGGTPLVDVVVGFAHLASYTIALVPPDMDISKAQAFVTAKTAVAVDEDHPLPNGWQNLAGWFVVVFGGVGDPAATGNFSVIASVLQDGTATLMTTTIAPGTSGSAATFLCSAEIGVA